jgi:hypothetical protein
MKQRICGLLALVTGLGLTECRQADVRYETFTETNRGALSDRVARSSDLTPQEKGLVARFLLRVEDGSSCAVPKSELVGKTVAAIIEQQRGQEAELERLQAKIRHLQAELKRLNAENRPAQAVLNSEVREERHRCR